MPTLEQIQEKMKKLQVQADTLIKGITGSNLLLQEDCEFGRGGCSLVQILLTQGAVQAD